MTTALLEAPAPVPVYYGPDVEHPYGVEDYKRDMQRGRRSLKIARPVCGSTWIQKNLSLDAKTSPDAVNRVGLFGYQLEMVDAMCDTTIPRVVVPKSARVGYSLMTTTAAAYLLGHEAAPVCYATQNEAKAQEWLKTNFNPLFKHPDNHLLRRIVRPARKGEDQDELLDRYYANGALFRGRSAASDDSFRGYRAKRMFCDEVDAKTWTFIGKDTQGDKIELALDRTAEYFDGGIVIGGTPTHLHSSLVWPNWLRTDQRKYFVPCPHCTGAVDMDPSVRDMVNFETDIDKPEVSGFQFLEFGDANTVHGIKFDTTPGVTIEAATYGCRHCGADIDETEPGTGYSWKAWMDRHGEWRPTNGTWRRGGRPGEWIAVESDAEPGWRGYHVWAAYSCAPGVTWLKIARTFLNAVRRGGRALQNFENTWKGLPWEARMSFAVPRASKLKEMTVNYPGECPEDVIFASIGADVQKGTDDGSKPPRLEVQFVGHGRRDTAIVLDYMVLDKFIPFSPQADRILDQLRARVFVTPSGRRVPIMASCIDRSFNPGDVLNHVAARWDQRVFAVRGDAAKDGKPKDNIVGKTPTLDKHNARGQWYTVDTIYGKREFFTKLQRGPVMGGLVIPSSLAYYTGYLEGLVSEKPRTLDNGWIVFEHNKGVPNESLDTLIYNLAAREIVKNMVKGYADGDLDKLADAIGVPQTLTVFSEIAEDRSVLAPVVAAHALAQRIVEMPGIEDHAHLPQQEAAPQGRFRSQPQVRVAGQPQPPVPADPNDPSRPRGLGPRVRVQPTKGTFRKRF